MKRLMTGLACIALLIGSSATAHAQDSDEWQLQIAPLFLWAMGIDGTMQLGGGPSGDFEVDPTVSFEIAPDLDPSTSWTDAFAGIMWRPKLGDDPEVRRGHERTDRRLPVLLVSARSRLIADGTAPEDRSPTTDVA